MEQTPNYMPELDKDKEIQNLRKELHREKLKVKLFKISLGLPLWIVYRLFFGERFSKSLDEVKEEVMISVDSAKKLDFHDVYDRLKTQAPKKLYNLAESFLLWRLKRGFLVVVIAALPTVFLIQQNFIIREQNDLLTVQNDFFNTQTELLRIQTDDEAISRAIADIREVNRVDYPQIKRIADKFKILDLARRRDQLNKLKALFDAGYVKQTSVFEENRKYESQGQEMVWGRFEILTQYEYLSVFLLISTLKENDFAEASWVGIYKLDLTNSDFSGADLSNVYLYDCKVDSTISAATISPMICKYPYDPDCP